jgi:hypothetical protein
MMVILETQFVPAFVTKLCLHFVAAIFRQSETVTKNMGSSVNA